MTTVAYRDGIMAADSMLTIGDTRLAHAAAKLVAASDGSIAGASGDTSLCQAFLQWVESESMSCCVPPPAAIGDFRYTGIVVSPGGTVLLYDGSPHPIRLEPAPYIAIGSGRDAALGAMAMGASAAAAVAIASEIDIYTGGRITTVSLREETTPARPVPEATQ